MSADTNDDDVAGPSCVRSSLPPAVRLAITFAVLFALKWSLPLLAIPVAAQVITLLVVATAFTYAFWWNCSTERRAPLVLIGVLWTAGVIKLLVQ